MDTVSFWQGTAAPVAFGSLVGDVTADVAIIGGGVTGVTAAHLLSEAGLQVVVLEAFQVGLGATGYSTGNLYATVDENLDQIRRKWGQDKATQVVVSRTDAMNRVEQIVNRYAIDCDFHRRPHYLFATEKSQVRELEAEYQALQAAGLRVVMTTDAPLPFPVVQAVQISEQAQFHPLRYVQGLAAAIASPRCQIYEHSKVEEIDGAQGVVRTAAGQVHAPHIIAATHTPKGVYVVHTDLNPAREYGVAARLASGDYPQGIFWSLEQPSHSIRSAAVNGEQRLIVIGEKHKTGQGEEGVDYFARVEQYVRAHFDVAAIEYRWSAQHYKPADLLPTIGAPTGSPRVYIATGFSTSGLIYGTLAAAVISDEILGRDNPWRDLYSASRFTPGKSATEFVKENLNVAAQYVRTVLGGAEAKELSAVGPGEGKIVEVGGQKLAVSRDDAGQLIAVSPNCTHLGCIVNWNPLERSWDCPCHGSRFRPDGEVIEGPAIAALARQEIT